MLFFLLRISINQTMQTRSGKISTMKGIFHVETNEELNTKISKQIQAVRRANSVMKQIPKLLKMIKIVNDNFDDKMSVWNGGKEYYYNKLNVMIFNKTFEFENSIREFSNKSEQENTHLEKRTEWNNTLKYLKLYQTKYAKHRDEMLHQIQDWIAGRGCEDKDNTTAITTIQLGVRDRIDLNIASIILDYLY